MLLLHLSDVHFRDGQAGLALDPNRALRSALVRDAEAQCAKIGATPDAILISGDLTFAGSKAEFDFAQLWLEDLCKRCGTDPSNVFLVPGNHDVVRKIAGRPLVQAVHDQIKHANVATLEGLITGLLLDDEASRLLYESLQNYNEFSSRFFCSLVPPERTTARRDLTLNDGSILRISGFNSTFVSSAGDAAGNLFIDASCFQLERERGVVHLAMCHHPFIWLRQGQALENFLNDTAHIQLFGHEHNNRIVVAKDFVRVYASAAQPDRVEGEWEPGYNLIELEVEGAGEDRHLSVKAHIRVWQKTPGTFRAKVTKDEVPVFKQTIRLDAWTPQPVNAAPALIGSDAAPLVAESIETPNTPEENEAMQTLREISVRFFKLTLSQKAAIAGRLDLLEEADAKLPDYERYRSALLRAKARGLIEELEKAVNEAAAKE